MEILRYIMQKWPSILLSIKILLCMSFIKGIFILTISYGWITLIFKGMIHDIHNQEFEVFLMQN